MQSAEIIARKKVWQFSNPVLLDNVEEKDCWVTFNELELYENTPFADHLGEKDIHFREV